MDTNFIELIHPKTKETLIGTKYICALDKRLGHGSFSDVYLGYALRAGETFDAIKMSLGECTYEKVAIKKIKIEKITKPKHQQQLDSEIDIMKGMRHENIVNLFDVLYVEDDVYLILEYCDTNLKAFLEKNGTVPRQRRKIAVPELTARKIMKQLLKGLKYLRSKSIIHRDLKPHNILLQFKKPTSSKNPLTSKKRIVVKIADFGFAKIVGDEELADTMCGSPLYMAPEIMTKAPYTDRTDLWSVGIILYEMLYAKHPYRNISDIFDLREKIQAIPISFPSSKFIGVSCKDLLVSLLQKNPKRRISWSNFFTHEWFYARIDDGGDASSEHSTIFTSPTKSTTKTSTTSTRLRVAISAQSVPDLSSEFAIVPCSRIPTKSKPIAICNDHSVSNNTILQTHIQCTTAISPPSIIIVHDYANNASPVRAVQEGAASPAQAFSPKTEARSPSPFFFKSHTSQSVKSTHKGHGKTSDASKVRGKQLRKTRHDPRTLEEDSRKDSSSIGQSIMDYMSASFGLIRDSFQQYNSLP